MRPSAADRVAPTLWDGLVALCVLALAAALAWALFPQQQGEALSAVVTLDGTTVATLPLSDAGEESRFLTLDEECPYPLILEYRQGAIRVSQTSCPGEDCLHTGWISVPGQQIVCLPNRLVVSLTGESSLPFDAETG